VEQAVLGAYLSGGNTRRIRGALRPLLSGAPPSKSAVSRLGRARHRRGGNSLRRWGYKLRKVLLTPWGLISGLRLPRLRDIEKNQEVAFLGSERAESRLAEGFFRNLRRFLGRFPGFMSPERALGLYLLGAEHA
jgi:hypothetical protein